MESLHEIYPHWTFTAESIVNKTTNNDGEYEKMEIE